MEASAATPETGDHMKTVGTVQAKKSDPVVGTEEGDGGTPDLPLPEPRSQPDDDATVVTAAAATKAALDAAAHPPPTASLADVLGKRASTPAVKVQSHGPKGKPLTSNSGKKKTTPGPGIASFFGGGDDGVGGDKGSDESDGADGHSPSTSAQTEAENFAAAVKASKQDEDKRRRSAQAAEASSDAKHSKRAEGEHHPSDIPSSAPLVSAQQAKHTHPLLLAAAKKKAVAEKAAADKALAERAAVEKANLEKAANAEAIAKAAAKKAAAKAEKAAKAERAAAEKAAKATKAAADTAAKEHAAQHAKAAAQTEAAAKTEAAAQADAIAKVELLVNKEKELAKAGEATDGTSEAVADVTKQPSSGPKNPFFMTSEERKRASVEAETFQKEKEKAEEERQKEDEQKRKEQSCADATAFLKSEIESVKKVDKELSAGRKPHHFFAMQKEKTAALKEMKGGSSSSFFQGAYFEPKPAPIEKAMCPLHVCRATDSTEQERFARVGLVTRMGPPRAAFGLTLTSTSNSNSTRLCLGLEFGGGTTEVSETEMNATNVRDTTDSKKMDTDESRKEMEDAMLTDTAKFVLASKGRWNAAAVVSGALASTRGELRRQLGEIRVRGGWKEPSDEANNFVSPATRSSDLWVDAYRPNATADCVGDPNAAAHIRDWLAHWQTQIKSEVVGGGAGDKPGGSKAAKKTKKPPKKKQKRDSSDEDWDPEDDDDDTEGDVTGTRYVPLIDKKDVPAVGVLCCGLSGSGKTATVYAAAKELGFTVLEVNASRKRSGADILNQFGEATQSRRLGGGGSEPGSGSINPNKPKGVGGLFGAFGVKPKSGSKKRKSDSDISQDDKDSSKDKESSKTSSQKNTLILFEEVDVLRGEDRGFMAALATLIRTSKRPIVLTSNLPTLPGLIGSVTETVAGVSAAGLPLARVKFNAPSAADVAAYASLVSSVEGALVSPGAVATAAAPDASDESVKQAGGGDLRRALHAAHFLSFSNSSPAASVTHKPCGATISVSLGACVASLVASTEGSALVASEASMPVRARQHVLKSERVVKRRDAKANAAAEQGAMRRSLAAIVAAEEAKKVRKFKNAEEKFVLLAGTTKEGKGSLGLTPVTTEEELKPNDDGDASDAETVEADAEGSVEKQDIEVEQVPPVDSSANTTMDVDASEEPRMDDPDDSSDDKELLGASDSDDDADDIDAPGDGWQRAMDEMTTLAHLADCFSAADTLRCPSAVGASGPAREPYGYACPSGFTGAGDADDDGAFDGTRAEQRGGKDLIGEPRSTLGGRNAIARDCAGVINSSAMHLSPKAPESDAVTPTTTLTTATPTATDARLTAVRLKELAESTGVAVIRGLRGGGGCGGAGEAVEKVAYLARMASLQQQNKETAKVRRRRPVKYLLSSAETIAELELVGKFGAAGE